MRRLLRSDRPPLARAGVRTKAAGRGLAVAVALAAMTAGCRGNKSGAPPVHLQQNMDFGQYFEAQEPNGWFHDGRAMRQPPAGTVARAGVTERRLSDDDFVRSNHHLYEGRGADGRLADALPSEVVLDEALLDRGRARYQIYCTPCHDATGSGHGMVMQRGFKPKAPTYHSDRLRAMPLGHFYDVITRGRGVMPSYAAQIPVRDRWAIAAWVRTLQVSQAARLEDVPAGVATNKGWTK